MDKLKMQSPNLVDANIAKIAELFPNCVTEAKDENGMLRRVVDFDQLRQELSANLVEGPRERYTLSWPGKNEAILTANAPIAKTLRPCEEESVDFENTKNLYIEGDNLDVLKLLQETYLNTVGMIYIDQPYNTGNDFIYEDDFAEDTDSFLIRSNQKDDSGNRLVANTEANGRFHSVWLTMMYPRLKLARNILRDDGIIFISIDDKEAHNLRKLCDEVFGAGNFIAQITREAIKGGSQSKDIRRVHDYVLCYAKDKTEVIFSGFEKEEIELDLEDENGKYKKGRELNKWGAGSRRADAPGMWFPVPGPTGEDVYPIRNDGSEGRWRLGKIKMLEIVNKGDVIFEKREDGSYIVYEKLRGTKPGVKQLISIFKDNPGWPPKFPHLWPLENPPPDGCF